MATSTYNEATGLAFLAFDPIIDMSVPSYIPASSRVVPGLNDQVVSYSHELFANGGFWSADLTLTGNVTQAEDWFEHGLGRHIEVYSPALDKVWEGFVNSVSISIGTLAAVRGPLLEVANRVSVAYTPILDATTVPPIEGTETTTTIAEDAASQALYGVLEAVVSGGRLLDDGTTDNAAQLRDTYLAETAVPQTGEALSLEAAVGGPIQLSLLGYVHRLQGYVYQDATSATVQADTKIQNVITADPSGLFSTDFNQIAANATLVPSHDDDNRSAWDVIQEIVSLGDAAFTRFLFGIYQDRIAAYNAVPTVISYQHATISNELVVEQYISGAPTAPWDIRPGRWLLLIDFLASRDIVTTIRNDPRYIFIESVHFTAPDTIKIEGQKASQIPQMIARLAG